MSADQIANTLAGHQSIDYEAGDGHETPREVWVACTCGATVWTWMQFYDDNDLSPDAEFREHVAEHLAPLIAAREQEAARVALLDAADDAFKDKKIQGLQRVVIGNWLRARAGDGA